jgi:Zn-dependent peptidase ImmA (M78 family)
MGKQIEAIINPELLVWARKSLNYDLVYIAKRMNKSVDKILEWETGQSRPTFNQLLQLADIYKRPVVVFYLPKPPNELDKPFDALDLRDFRKLPDVESKRFSSALLLELREAEYRREQLLDLSQLLGQELSEFTWGVNKNEMPDILAQRIRADLKITSEDQRKWRNANQALRAWMTALEQQNILIFQTGFFQNNPVELTEMRGIAISFSRLPIIILNVKDAVNGRIFTLMHELCHLLLQVSGVSNSYEYYTAHSKEEEREIFCNRFAAEMLVPANSLLSSDIVQSHDIRRDWDDFELNKLANRYRVSKEVILRRLVDVQSTTREFYQFKRAEYIKEYESREKTGGFSSPHEKFVRVHGVTYVSTILDAYYSGVINTNDASEYLGVKPKYLTKVQEHLSKVVS